MIKLLQTILLGMTFFVVSAHAQTFELGEESKSKEKTKNIYQLSDGSFFTTDYIDDYEFNKKSAELSYYKGSKRVSSAVIEAKVNGEKGLIDNIIGNKDQLLVFIVLESKSKVQLFRQAYGSNCLPEGSAVEIISYDIDKKHGAGFRYAQSKNRKFFCVDAVNSDYETHFYKYKTLIFNEQYNIVSESSYEMSRKGDGTQLLDLRLSDNGNFYALYKVHHTNEKDKIDYSRGLKKFHLIQTKAGKAEQNELQIKTTSFIHDLMFDIESDAHLSITGIYDSEKKDQALFFYQYDLKENKTLNQGLLPLTLDMIPDDEEETGEESKDKKLLLSNYVVRDIHSMNDGSFVGVLEYYQSYTVSSQDGSTSHYIYGDILTYKINASGKMDWVTPIRCYQHHNIKNNHGSFAGYWHGDDYYLYFGDKIGNYEKDGKYHHGFSKILPDREYCVSQVKLNLSTGKYERTIFLNKKRLGKMVAMPTVFSANYGISSMVFFFNQKKNEVLGTLKFN